MSEKTILWDNFENEPTLTRDEAAPPERYTEVFINPDGAYLEVWKADAIGGQEWKHTNIFVEFTETEWNHAQWLQERRDDKAKEKEVKLVRMVRWYVPLAHYEHIALWAQSKPGKLTPDDVETIRIHLSAIKEGLCNQGRWREAQEYEDLIERFLYATSAAGHYRPQDRRTENND